MRSARKERSISAFTDSFADTVTTVTETTRAKPIVNALAVVANRRGARRAFRAASFPLVRPISESNGETSRTIATPSNGASSKIAISRSRTPIPTWLARAPVSVCSRPCQTSTPAPSRKTKPKTVRTLPTPSRAPEDSRKAATGGTRDPLTAGNKAEIKVTTTPIANAQPTAAGVSAIPAVRLKPKEPKRAVSPKASR